MTTQDKFTMLRGHINNGQKVQMVTGEIFTIKSTLRGWKIVDETGKDICIGLCSAFAVECFIVNY